VIYLLIELAKQVCSQGVFEARANANRSCTATSYIPEMPSLRERSPLFPRNVPQGVFSNGIWPGCRLYCSRL
jgi:hypothetical protein